MGYHFVPECNHAQESHKYQFLPFLFPAIFNGPQFVEIQKFCYYGKVTKRLLLFIKTVIHVPSLDENDSIGY